jgi:hypothetical protein
MVDAESLDLDDDMAGLGLRLRQVLVNQAVQPTELGRLRAWQFSK